MIEVVAIDGPSGCGKSTCSRLLAFSLKYSYLDTGAMYRAFALLAIINGVEENPVKYKKLLNNFRICFVYEDEVQRILCNDLDITEEIRNPKVSLWASTLSADIDVRHKMGHLQREIGSKGKIVAEGRDMGTVIFPNAFAKFFLTARVEVRAQRRHGELREKGFCVSIQEVMDDMIKRDSQDSERDIAPLVAANDAIIIDTSDMNVADVVNKMYCIVLNKLKTWK